MSHARFELGPTATYTRRTLLWVGGAGSGDGVAVVTVYAAKKLPESKVYWVESQGDAVVVWEAGGGDRRKAYTVTAGRCSCDGMRKMAAKDCKHKRAVDVLIGHGLLRQPWRKATVPRRATGACSPVLLPTALRRV